jgi:hypothetical protein
MMKRKTTSMPAHIQPRMSPRMKKSRIIIAKARLTKDNDAEYLTTGS